MALALPPPPELAPDAPGWLSDRWRTARGALEAAAWPTVDEEVWRYSEIGSFPDALGPAGTPPAELPSGARAALESLPAHVGVAVVVDGHLRHRRLDEGWEAKGVVVAPASTLPDGASLVADLLDSPDVFSLAAVAYSDPVVVRVPDGIALDRPLVVLHWSEQEGVATYDHVIVDVGRDAEATVLEVERSGPGSAFRSSLVDARVAPAGRLRHLGVQDLERSRWRFLSHRVAVDSQASLTAMQVALGGAVTRTRSECRLVGRGASGDLLALYFGTGQQVLDFRTFQHHEAPDTTSNLLFKGAVGDHARSVYTGLIRVHPDARGTNAFQTNRNLKLSDDAWADSVPNLEIENNDVRCSHASTVGPVDEEQRFYLESRGVPPRVADRLIVAGFFDEVLQQVPVPELLPGLRAALTERFAEVDALAIEEVA